MKKLNKLAWLALLLPGFSSFTTSPAQEPLKSGATVISSDVVVSTSVNGQTQQEIHKFYRNADGSTRTEIGDGVFIDNKRLHKTIILDLRLHSAQEINLPIVANSTVASDPSNITGNENQGSFNHLDLGTRTVSGILVIGSSCTLTNAKQGETKIETWNSSALDLTIQTTVQTLGTTVTTTYTNISTSPALSDDLFSTPAGFAVTTISSSNS